MDDFGFAATDKETGQKLFMTTHNIGVSQGFVRTLAETPMIITGAGPGAGGGIPGGGSAATITYTFNTSTAASLAGRLSGSFVVPRAAIGDGILTFSEITAANFSLSDTQPPYTPITHTLADFTPRISGPDRSREVRVDPATGVFLHDFFLSMGRPGTTTVIELFPHRFLAFAPSVISPPASARGQGGFTVTGYVAPAGGTPPVALPLLHPLALAALLALVMLAGLRLLWQRRA